ncbi:MAG: VCBS repeat-containing protein [Planctomycetota bacterium]|nr:VCBS repeat-containing protein [Planctomycetota bacterium]
MMLPGRRLVCCVLACAGILLLPGHATRNSAAQEPAGSLADYYGFGRLELYKMQHRSGNLLAADFNQDGKTDLILVDNSNSRLDLLQQQTKIPDDAAPAGRVNSLNSDRRFEHRKIPVDREVASLTSGDFNGDGRKDLAWFAVPDQLTIAFQNEKADFTSRKRLRLPDVQAAQWVLAAGDLNHDGRDDLVVLGKHDTYLIYQQAGGELSSPVRLMNTTENLGLVQIADLDGDGKNDLSYLNSSDPDRPFCVRLQGPDGRMGPELRCELPKTRGVTLANIDGKPGSEVLAIESQTGRVKIHQLQQSVAQPGELAGQLIQYGFGQQGKNRDLATGDLNKDGLIDVVVSDPESAQMIVFLQRPGAGLDLGNTYPGLVGAEQVRVGDVDGDGQNEVVVLSPKEKTIGICRIEAGRLTFPKALPTEREPVALDLADLNGDGRPEVVYLSRERSAQSSKYFLQAVGRGANADYVPHKFGEQDAIAVTLKTSPDRLVALDANQDGRPDFLVFAGTDRAPVFLATAANGVPAEVAAGEGGFGLGNVAPGGLFLGKLEQPVVLVAQSNFARNVIVNEKNQWQVVDQYNAAEAGAKIVGAATVDLDGEPGREIVLIDSGVRKLRILRREGAVFRAWREVDIGAFPYKSVHVADLNGDMRDDLLLFGEGKFGVLYAGRSDPRLNTIASYESKLDKVHFNDLAAGDLNGDGLADLAVVDTQSQIVDILNYDPTVGLRHAVHFKVFEAKSLAGEERTGSEPREVLISDVTGDGLADLILLSQDRVLVYPQDSAPAVPAAGAADKK